MAAQPDTRDADGDDCDVACSSSSSGGGGGGGVSINNLPGPKHVTSVVTRISRYV